MIIINRKDNMYLTVVSDDRFANTSYSIHRITIADCVEERATLTGGVDADGNASFKLPDGKYRIKLVHSRPDIADLEQEFLVMYNYLPTLMEYIEDAICGDLNSLCPGCGDDDEKTLQENFFKTFMYLNCIGVFSEFTLVKFKSCLNFNAIKNEEETRRYYGRFNYNYKRALKEFFAYLYVELYNRHIRIVRDVEDAEGASLKEIFQFKKMRVCLHRMFIDYDNLICKFDELNCDCDE